MFKNLIIVAMCLVGFGCNYSLQKALPLESSQPDEEQLATEHGVTTNPVPVKPPVVVTPMTYEMVYKQVIAPSCLKCHSGGSDINLETYQNLLNLKDAVRAAIIDGSMPRRSQLTVEQKKLIIEWVDAGAHEFGEGFQNLKLEISNEK